VHPAEIRKEGLVPFHVFKISTAPSIVNHVFRRYSDFEWLREHLVTTFPGLFVPPLPPKSLMTKAGAITKKQEDAEPVEVLVERQIGLQRFLARCIKVPIICASAALQLFLNRTQTFKEASGELSKNAGMTLSKKLKDMVPSAITVFSEDSMEILHKYKDTFPQIMEQPLPDNSDAQVKQLEEFIKVTEDKVAELVSSTAGLVQYMGALTKDILKFNTHLQSIYTLEQGYPECPKPMRVDVMSQMNSWQLALERLAPSYKGQLLRMFQYELEDVLAFQDLLKRREVIRLRFQKASKAADKWRQPTQGVETEKMRLQRTQDLAKEAEEQQLHEAVTKLILNTQIQQLWESKTLTFKQAFAAFSKHQQEVADQCVGIWQEALARIDQQ